MTKVFSAALAVMALLALGAIITIGSLQNGELPPSVTLQPNPDVTDNPNNATTTASTTGFPENTGSIDDWKYDSMPERVESVQSTPTAGTASGGGWSFMGMGGGATNSAKMAAPAADMMMESESIGLAVGGAKDTNNFRQNIKDGYLPLDTDITYEGLYYSYYFDTGKANACEKLFCPSYSKAVSKDPFSGKDQYFLTVGLNSGIKESDFNRKKLNLVVVMDISGSMGSPFDQYYYDQYGNYRTMTDEEQKEASKSKMQIADESVVAMTKHLRADDRFGVVLFDDSAYVAKPLSKVGVTDMDKIRKHIMEITEQGSTNMEDGINEATKLFAELKDANQNEYENRIIFITDAQPNTGGTSEENFIKLISDNADDKIYMTFIGVGVDFNTTLIDSITKVRGANYYSVHSSKEFAKRMDDEFDYMVTPLVFDLELKMKANGYKIVKVYGSPEANMATGEIMKVSTLFPSATTSEGTKGGIILLQLEKVSDNATITLLTSYEDRSGKLGGDTATITFNGQNPEYFENTGIRKGILLARYGNMMKDWIYDERSHQNYSQPTPWEPMVDYSTGIYCPPPAWPSLGQWERQSISLNVSPAYKKLFGIFKTYFDGEMKAIGDKDLQQESDILKKLGS